MTNDQGFDPSSYQSSQPQQSGFDSDGFSGGGGMSGGGGTQSTSGHDGLTGGSSTPPPGFEPGGMSGGGGTRSTSGHDGLTGGSSTPPPGFEPGGSSGGGGMSGGGGTYSTSGHDGLSGGMSQDQNSGIGGGNHGSECLPLPGFDPGKAQSQIDQGPSIGQGQAFHGPTYDQAVQESLTRVELTTHGVLPALGAAGGQDSKGMRALDNIGEAVGGLAGFAKGEPTGQSVGGQRTHHEPPR